MDNNILIYTGSDGLSKVDVRLEDDTLWLTQAQMCELYSTSKSNISEHIKHIFEEGELTEVSVVRNFRTTAADGQSYLTTFYNLDMIIALGYRVRSITATRFRQWATLRLKEYIQKGFTIDDERLKQLGGGGYWKELLARIRDIRATEKVFYRQVLEIYATSIDYDPRASVSQDFFKKVQNSYTREYGRRVDCATCRCRKRLYGAFYIPRFATDFGRSAHGEKLPQRERTPGNGATRVRLSGLR